jgi:PEP-CTERM motif
LNDPLSNDNLSHNAATGKLPRRKRSWYRRRLRMRRTLVAVLVGTALAVACWQNAASYFSLPALHSSQLLPDSFRVRTNLHKDLALAATRSLKPAKFLARVPGVYPYSVVPGGVKNAAELREAAARDYAIRRHYAQFNFENARMLRLTEAREVYLSYRIRNTVFWTHKKVRLLPGELLLTDGKITARARCGNQISDVAKPEVSNEEPDEDVLDQPVAALEPALSSPVRPMLAPPDLPAGEPVAPHLFAGAFVFPYVPIGAPVSSSVCGTNDHIVNGRCVPKHKKPVVPEPSTMLLAASGMALVMWRYKKIARPATV